MQLRRVLPRFLALAVTIFAALTLFSSHAHAATDGRLIDDSVWDNSGTMSATDIQNFLNQFPNSCLKSYNDVLPSADPTQAYFNYSGSASAATIIRRVADDYGVNPRVILTKLQQEQSLVTGDSGCAGWRYTGAMGFNCPDGQSCPVNPDNAGFSKQVTRGMWLLKMSKERANGNLNWLVPDDASWVYGGPMTAGYRKRCGTCATIYYDGYWNGILLETGSTASLYNYTPHVPSSFDNIYEAWWGSTYGGSWNFESLDGSVGSINANASVVGGSPKAIQFGTVLHTFYYDNTAKALRWAYNNANGWNFAILDGAGGVAGSSSANVGKDVNALVFGGALHIYYYDSDNGNLRHAWSSNGTSWQFETLDGASTVGGRVNADLGYTPSATAFGNTMQLFYYDNTNHALRHAWWDTNSSAWYFEYLEGSSTAVRINPANIGRYSSTATFGTTLQVLYYDVTNGNLRHAWADGTGWHFENLDGDPGSIGRGNADLGHFPVALQYNNTFQIYYYDVTNGNLRHAWADGTGWHFENLDGDPGSIGRYNSDVGMFPSVTVFGGQLQVTYYERLNGGRLRHAWTNPALGWLTETLDGAPQSVGNWNANVGFNSTITTYNDTLQLFYTDATNGDLRHAWPR